MAIIAVYWDQLIGWIWPRYRPKPVLTYLDHRDSELGPAIIAAAHRSAYGRWRAAQTLISSRNRIQEPDLYRAMANRVMAKIVDGEIEVRGRKPGEMDYRVIPRERWRSSVFHVIDDPRTLWKIIIRPKGALLGSDGKFQALDAASAARTAQLDYDSFVVDAYQFERVLPRRDRIADRERRGFLRQARRRWLDPNEIKRLS